jgi:hypothetical protein
MELQELDRILEIQRNMGNPATVAQMKKRNRLAAIAASADKR